ncbi:ExeM/NucH family extracellular endonuclease [Salipiger sp. IMCC34102]|uniref:ExeM/NucH family extracellular endonuclease n=1 Tax=Salipiger sp. IMCC34102 TaxID=2510647 RepID=UPI00101C0DC0|nr:ExeM/NucH family extracellular endonuclease [Salipiger sp. IMCC34102]RYH01292.1 ExeM/NucH family extracellular endonuclease [Salipiger sp. IMCC34102]
MAFFKLGLKFGGFGPSVVNGSAGRDILFGGFGNDVLRGNGGRDYLFGGFGTDTAVFSGGVEDYAIETRRGKRAEITDENGDTTRTFGVERLYFEADDYTVDLTGANNAVLARDDARAVGADAPALLTGLLDNDYDFDGDALTITGIDTSDTVGTATLNEDGSISYDAGGAFDSLAEGETATTTLTYTVTDGQGSTKTATVTITVTGVNDAPELTVADATVDENTTAVLTAAARDVDGDDITYTISGTDAARFTIDPETGVLAFAEAPDFEAPGDADGDNVYDLTVTASDGKGGVDSQDISVTVADVDEAPAVTAYFNEIHYDNAGADEGEFVEIAGTAGADLTGWTVAFYNGSNGTVYRTEALTALSGTDGTGYAVVTGGSIQNGSPDGMALVDASGTVVEFLSYEGTLTAVNGPATGLTSTDIGVEEGSDTPVGFSLQRQADGTWAAPAPETPGAANDADDTPPAEVEVYINEFHYDNAGADEGEFIEIAGTAGTDLTGFSLELVNGSNGAVYRTVALDGTLSGTGGTGYFSVSIPGIQNGSPDGIVLVGPDGAVVEFLSYEGTMTATSGAAEGLTSTDIGVSEPGDTPVGFSLQRNADGTWDAPREATRDAANDAGAPADAPRISELAVNTSGTDWEFAEISGTPGFSLDGYQLVQVRGVPATNGAGEITATAGEVYNVIDLSGTIGETGFFLAASPQAEATFSVTGDVAISNNTFLNASSSFLLVKDAGLSRGDDLDLDDDGTVDVDVTVVDSVALTQGDDPVLYSETVVGPDGSFLPAGTELQDDGSYRITSFGDPSDYSPTAGNTPPPPPPPTGTVLISTVQGEGAESALAGATVTVEGVVTALVANGFYLQEEDSDSDGNDATSEGIFVFTGGAPSVALLDVAEVTGEVSEYFGFTQVAGDLVTVTGTDVMPTAAALTLPFATDVDLESVEGMRVTLSTSDGGDPLTVIENYQLGQFGQFVVSEGIQYNPTQLYDAQTQRAEIDALFAQNEANRILIDDGSSAQNPDEFTFIPNQTAGDNGNGYLDSSDTDGTLRLGAEITQPIEGVMNFSFGEYRIIPTEQLAIDESTNSGARQASPDDVGGSLKVASFNTLNYFTTLNERGAETAAQFDRQEAKIVNAILSLDASVVGLQEIENNGFGEGSAIDTLVDALNDVAGAGTWAFVDPTQDGGRIGTDAITTGMIYRTDDVTLNASDFLVFDDGGTQRNRPAIAASFTDNDTGGTFTLANNHFKSKGGSGSGGDADIGDGQGNFNETRTEAAEQLVAWLDSDPLGSGDPDYLIIGDLNAYMQEDPVQAIEAAGYVNLLEQFIGSEDAFSFTFDGQRGALDHALATASMAEQVTGVIEWHVNSPEPSLLDYRNGDFYDADAPWAASDHDPLVVGLNLTGDDATFLS